MPRITYELEVPDSFPQTAVVIDAGFAELLGIPAFVPAALSCNQNMVAHYKAMEKGLKLNPEWLATFYEWVVGVRPTIVSLSPDILIDTLLYRTFLSPESYGFGIHKHVPALYKPNGSLNWFQHKGPRILKPPRGFFALRGNVLACCPDLKSPPFSGLRQTSPVVSLGENASSLVKQVRLQARKRLESASEVLLLGLDPSTLNASDTQLLSELTPSRRLTLIAPTPSSGTALRDLCGLSGFMDIEFGGLDSWIVNRLHKWSSV